MKEIHIVWNKVTAHSRFWSFILFIGVLPAVFFYAGMSVERLNNIQRQLSEISQQTLYQSEHGMCRITDCTLQVVSGTATTPSAPSINVVAPKQGDRIDPKSPVKVIWNTSPNFPISQVTVLLLDSKGRAASSLVKVSTDVGTSTIKAPTKVSPSPYVVLIQGAVKPSSNLPVPFAYSGEFYL